MLFEQLLYKFGVGGTPDVHFMVQARILMVIKVDFLLLQLRFQPGDILAGNHVFLAHDDGKVTQLLVDRLWVV